MNLECTCHLFYLYHLYATHRHRLATYGWKNLPLQNGVDITRDNLQKELLKDLTLVKDSFETLGLMVESKAFNISKILGIFHWSESVDF